MPPFGLVCDAGRCREAQTWDEILPTCSSQKEANAVDWCITYAAQSAFDAGETGQAVEICNQMQGGDGDMPKSQQCLMQVARNIIEKDPREALDFCRANMDRTLAMCLNESGYALAKTDLDAGLAICTEIVPNYTDGQFQKDACYHNIAMIVAPQDLERAKQICEMMSADIEYCKETAAKQ
jgi:outer membrane PBP1 activator LpoA protein